MFKHTQPTGDLPPLKAKNVDGKRFYEHITTGEKYPSITRIRLVENMCYFNAL